MDCYKAKHKKGILIQTLILKQHNTRGRDPTTTHQPRQYQFSAKDKEEEEDMFELAKDIYVKM